MPSEPVAMNVSRMPAAVLAGPAPARRRVQWRRALRAIGELLDEPERTEKAFEVFHAIDGNHEEGAFQRLLRMPEGRRLLRERPALLAALSDRAALARLAEDSFGRAYLAYLDANGFEPAGLVNLKNDLQARYVAAGEPAARLDEAREWYRDRALLVHDLWHVLTGYGADELGEAALLPFSWAQSGGRANALLTVGVALRGTATYGPAFLRYLVQAWRRGRRTPWLGALSYEQLLPLPLAEARARAGVVSAEVSHPGGIWRGSYDGIAASA